MTVIVESFEGLSEGPNSPLFYTGALRVGFQSEFAFASGARMVAHIPNTIPGPAFVADFALGYAGAPLQTGGPLTAETVPTGTAYFHTNFGSPAFAFNAPVFTVSVKGIADDFVGLAAYDASGKLLAASEVRTVATANWDTNVVQVMSKVAIATVTILGDDTIIDDLTFDTEKPLQVKGSGGNDKLSGSNSAELILGKTGNDKIKGRDGDDTIDGSKGNDKIKGEAGNDTIIGGDGTDKLTGGVGQDSFVFGALGAIDKVKDFDPFDDTIVLTRSVFSELAFLEIVIGTEFQVGAAAATPDHRIVYDFNTGALFYDRDGNGATVPIQFAQLAAGLALSGDDFLVA